MEKSECCNAILYPFGSGGGNQVKGPYKMCVECYKHYSWNLKETQ